MRIRILIKSILLAFASLIFFSACSNKKGKNETFNQVITLKGDPIEMVAGTSTNSQTHLPSSFFGVIQDLRMERLLIEERFSGETMQDLVSNQMNVNQDESQVQAQLKRTASKFTLIEPTFGLEFNIENEGYALTQFSMGADRITAGDKPSARTFQILHQSMKADGSAASILIYFGDKGNRRLLSLTFMHTPQQNLLEKVSEKFLYLLGPGIKNTWKNPKEIPLSACGSTSKVYHKLISNSVRKWEQSTQYTVTMNLRYNENCPPFSDLNTHTLTFVNAFVERPDANELMAGVTVSAIDPNQGRILDSDIFIYKKEFEDAFEMQWKQKSVFEKMVHDPDFSKSVASTITHELGHFLGLHHQPDPAIKSIMSYGRDIYDPQAYDVDAVKALYRK